MKIKLILFASVLLVVSLFVVDQARAVDAVVVTPISVTCTASVASVFPGESVTYTAVSTGGNETVTYSWSGSDLSGNLTLNTVTATYPLTTKLGKKEVTVIASSNGKSKSAKCSSTVKDNVVAKIACIGAAASARETALMTALNVEANSMKVAYEARSAALTAAYALSDVQAIKVAVKRAWENFNVARKSVTATWKTAKNAAWAQYKTATTACRSTLGIGDISQLPKEMSGQ